MTSSSNSALPSTSTSTPFTSLITPKTTTPNAPVPSSDPVSAPNDPPPSVSASASSTTNTKSETAKAQQEDQMSKPLPLTLILAATPSLGIGRAGGLPWPSLRTEMGYFARVTKRVPVSTGSEGSGTANGKRLINAVVMGRKTWDSIPEKFRPLKGRLNVVITRDVKGFLSREGKREVTRDEGPIVAGSLEDALEILRGINNPSPASATSSTQKADDGRDSIPSDVRINHTFITGGSTLYTSALSLPQTVRILLTEIKTEYECDTFFGLDLGSEEAKRCGWRKRDVGAVREWTGEEKEGNVVVEGGVEEKGVRFEFGMWEREVEGV